MNTDTRQYQFRAGDDVISADGDKVGSLADLYGSYLVVEKGFFFPKDYYIPFSTVTNYEQGDGKIFLSVGKDEALHSGWDQKPKLNADDYATNERSASATTTTAATGDRTAPMDRNRTAPMDGDRSAPRTAAAPPTGDRMNRSDKSDQDNMRIPVHEEQLVPTKTVRQAGQVRVSKGVTEEERQIEVPVTEERVRVTRQAVDRPADSGTETFRQDSFEVPVRTEDVGVDKVVRVAEEIGIEKTSVPGTKTVKGTVRKEHVDVDESGTDSSIYADRTGDTASS